MRILCLQHVPFEGPGAVADWAARRGHDLEAVVLSHGAFAHPAGCDMLVVMGGPMSVDQELDFPWLAEEKAFIRQTIDAGALVLGVCLGAQLVAEVLGGTVTRAVQAEIGWYPVTLTAEGMRSAVFGGMPLRFDVLHWHGDTFSTPPGANRVASSAATPDQAFEYDDGRVVAMQFHLEATPASWDELCESAAGDLEQGGEWVSTADEMLGKRALFTPANGILFGALDAMAALRVTR